MQYNLAALNDAIPEGYDIARQKIYGVQQPPLASTVSRLSTANTGPADPFLPPMPSANPPLKSTLASTANEDHIPPLPPPPQSTTSRHAPNMKAMTAPAVSTMDQQMMHHHQSVVPANLALAQIEKLRAVVREKEVEMLKLRHENILLKQIERRQQKDLEHLESQSDDAPRIIHGLRDEISGLKHKLKLYFAQLSTDARQIRHIGEEKRRLREQCARLEKLVADEGLAQKAALEKQAEEALRRATQLEKIAADATKRAECIEKNLSTDNRHLRGRLHNLERENGTYKEKMNHLEDVIKEKDKEIASLSIYRYNAVHRKVEAVCRNCLKREKAESESKRRAEILERLPPLSTPKLTLASATSVDVSIIIPPRRPITTIPHDDSDTPLHATLDSDGDVGAVHHPAPRPTSARDGYEFSRLTLLCSDDPRMVQNVRAVAVDLDVRSGRAEIGSAGGKDRVKTSEASGGERKESRNGTAQHLEGDGEGQVDAHNGDVPADKLEHSAAATSRAITAKSADVGDRVASGVIPATPHTVQVVGLECGKFYYFQLVASHLDVDGPPSLIENILVDALPPPPPKPIATVYYDPLCIHIHIPSSPTTPLTPSSHHATTSQPGTATSSHSPIQKYRIYHSNEPNALEEFFIAEVEVKRGASRRRKHKRAQSSNSDRVTESAGGADGETARAVGGRGGVVFVYNSPQLGVPHYFRVRAVNAMGVGEYSEKSDEVLVDIVPSQPGKPRIKKLTATSIRVCAATIPNGGSDIDTFRITVCKIPPESEGSKEDQVEHAETTEEKTEILVPASPESVNSGEFVHAIDELHPGTTYKLTVEAKNREGWSEASEFSDPVNLDIMIPSPSHFTIDITSPTSAHVTLPPYPPEEGSPKILGCRVLASARRDMSDATAVAEFVPVEQTETDIDGLTYGGYYYFA
ncbi:hypothetical protein HK104_008794, partial [Borealophlyctis nickersoniae]